MPLTDEMKNKMIQRRLDEYESKIFSLEMDKTALLAIQDEEGVKNADHRIESLRKAHEAVKGLMTDANSNTNEATAEADI